MSPIDPSLSIDSVELAVSDLGRSVDFYERVLGLALISREDHRARLGADPEHPTLVLQDIASPTQVPANSTGLFHVAWLHPTRAGLADTVRRVLAGGHRFDGASDHGVSEALYLSDPDGLGIEVYADRPRESWKRGADGHSVEMVTLALDLEDLLAQAEPTHAQRIAPGTGIGHVHLKVSDVPRAAAFYRDVLGLAEQARLPSAAFLAAGGYHHHIGLNSWHSRGGVPAPDSAPGLRGVVFALESSDTLEQLQSAVAGVPSAPSLRHGESGSFSVQDPDGQLLTFTASLQDRARDLQHWPAEE